MERISLAPFVRGLSNYSWEAAKGDLLAAIAGALIALPQAMACALMAGLPPSVGIFGAIFGTIFAASFGQCGILVAGPTNTVAILLQAAIAQVLFAFYRDADPAQRQALALHITIELACIVGILQIVAACTGLGKIAQFVSRPVVKGYVIGAALMIIAGQLFPFTGLASPDPSLSLYARLVYFVRELPAAHLPTLTVGLVSLVLMLALKRWNRRFPAAALTFVLVGVLFFLLNPKLPDVRLVRDVGAIGEVYPTVALPYLDLRVLNILLPVGFAIALLGIIEVTSIVKTVSAQSGQSAALSQDVFALGVANLFSSFLGAMPSSGSFSRSRLNVDSGAATHLSAVFSGLFVAILVFAMGPAVGFIPLSAMAALLFLVAVAMVDWDQVRLSLCATRSDAAAFLCTLIACLVFSLDVAFYVGVIISISLYLRKAATPAVREMTMGRHGSLRPLNLQEKPLHPQIRIIDVDGDLFFGAVDFFQETMQGHAGSDEVKVLILRLKNAHHLDATTCLALRHLLEHLRRQNRRLILCGLTSQVWNVLRRSHLMGLIGGENIFLSDPLDPVGSSKKAFLRAEALATELAEPQPAITQAAAPPPAAVPTNTTGG
jgi:sulfate permease, SulP family